MNKTAKIRFLFLVFLFINIASAQKTAVLPFRDKSGFKGNWRLSSGIQKYLMEYLEEDVDLASYQVVTDQLKAREINSLNFARDENIEKASSVLSARFLIAGTINNFYVNIKMAGNSKAGGYKHYSGGVELDVKIYDSAEKKWIDSFPVKIDKVDKGMRINMPAKLSECEENYYQMKRRKFGSEPFKKTVAGMVMDEACKQIKGRLEIKMAASDSTEKKRKPAKVIIGKIVDVAGQTAYINLGFEDSVYTGEKLTVYREGKVLLDPDTGDTLGVSDVDVGQVEIVFIKSRHLSSTKILSGEKEMKVRDKVRLVR